MPDWKVKCNCPDFIKRLNANPGARSPSNFNDRDWSDSDAGVTPGMYCKHIWAAIIADGRLGEVGVPKDYPIERVTATARKPVKYGYSKRYGDNFL